jgi:hypothetical protein
MQLFLQITSTMPRSRLGPAGINSLVERIYADDIAACIFHTVAIGGAASQANGQRNLPQTGGFDNFSHGLQQTSLCIHDSAIMKPFYAEHVQPPASGSSIQEATSEREDSLTHLIFKLRRYLPDALFEGRVWGRFDPFSGTSRNDRYLRQADQ